MKIINSVPANEKRILPNFVESKLRVRSQIVRENGNHQIIVSSFTKILRIEITSSAKIEE